jgi:glycosyltransferase involved in cell wall biosynthesis
MRPSLESEQVRALYSFPHKIGADRICTTAWCQAAAVAEAGASVIVYPGAVQREFPAGSVQVQPTLARGRVRLPYRAVGRLRALDLHDLVVSRRLPKIAADIDLVHAWPLASRRTLRVASSLGIPTVLERPNAHTRFAYSIVQAECERLGISLPPDHEHAFQDEILEIEEEEYALADYILCPSEFVVKTFLEEGFPRSKLLREIYGFDPTTFFPPTDPRPPRAGLIALQVGVAAVRKGQHLAVEAWLRSSAAATGTFSIVGGFLPAYRELLASSLAHPSIETLGHRTDVPDLMRGSDVLLLPSLEEGFGLVCTEAMASGCVPVVSDACTDLCRHGENSLVHEAGDVETLANHLTLLDQDRELLERLRSGALATAAESTWKQAGIGLLDAYRQAIRGHRAESVRAA